MPTSTLFIPSFKEAANDYFQLLNRDYPERPALKLVGDRYRLSRLQRNCLYRGITSRNRAGKRRSKRIREWKNRPIHIDGYNLIFTVMNYLLGKVLFMANDGYLRDSGESYGNIENHDLFLRSAEMLLDYLSTASPERIMVYLDTSVECSGDHRKIIMQGLQIRSLQGRISLSKHADTELLKIKQEIIATSDSEIIDRCGADILDLARNCLEEAFQPEFPDLGKILGDA